MLALSVVSIENKVVFVDILDDLKGLVGIEHAVVRRVSEVVHSHQLVEWDVPIISAGLRVAVSEVVHIMVQTHAEVHVGLPIDHCYILLEAFHMDDLVVSLLVAMIVVDFKLVGL